MKGDVSDAGPSVQGGARGTGALERRHSGERRSSDRRRSSGRTRPIGEELRSPSMVCSSNLQRKAKERSRMRSFFERWGFNFTTLRTVIIACVLASIVSLVGGLYLYLTSLQTIERSMRETSLADTGKLIHQLNASVHSCIRVVQSMQAMYVMTSKTLHTCSNPGEPPAKQAKDWDTLVRWWEFAWVRGSRSVQELGIILLPHHLDDPSMVYTHVWYDLLADGGREYVHARYGPHLRDFPADPRERANNPDWMGAHTGYYRAPWVGVYPDANGFSDGIARDANQTHLEPPVWHMAKVDALDPVTGRATHLAYNFSITRWQMELRNFSLATAPADYVPAGWRRVTDGSGPFMYRWRDPQVWYASDSNPYVFIAYDVVHPPPPPPHPWSGYRAIMTQAYFVFATWNDIVREYWRDALTRGNAPPAIVLYDKRTAVVYASTTGERLVNASLQGARSAGTDIIPSEYFVYVRHLNSAIRTAVNHTHTRLCNATGRCFVVADCGKGMGGCFLRRQDLFSFHPAQRESTIDATLLWLRAEDTVTKNVQTALLIVIGMVIGVVALIGLVAIWEVVTASMLVQALLSTARFGVTDSFTQDAKDNAAQADFWENEGLAALLKRRVDENAIPTEAREQSAVSGLDPLMCSTVDRALDPTGPVQWLQAKCSQDPGFLEKHDPVGATLLHWCVLQGSLGNTAARLIAEHLITHHRYVVNQEYQVPRLRGVSEQAAPKAAADLPPPKAGWEDDGENWQMGKYDGETALHLAVVLGNMQITKMLLDAGADPFARAYGSFFAPGRQWTAFDKAHTYFGEYALSFAVGLGNFEMVKLLLNKAHAFRNDPRMPHGGAGTPEAMRKLLRAQDSFGNTPMHIAVLHRQIPMLDFIKDQVMAAVSHLGETAPMRELHAALHVRGAQGLTPLGLATVLGDPETFSHMMEYLLTLKWKFGKVRCCEMPLYQIDTIALPTGEKHRSVLNLIHLWSVNKLTVNHLVVRLIDTKWELLSPFFYVSLASHTAFLCILVLLGVEYIEVQQKIGSSTAELIAYEVYAASWCVILVTVTVIDVVAGIQDMRRQQAAAKKQFWMDDPDRGDESPRAGAGAERTWGGIPEPPDMPDSWPTHGDKIAALTDWDIYWRSYVERVDVKFLPSSRNLLNTVPMSEWAFMSWAGQVVFLLHVITYSNEGMSGNASPLSSALLAIALLTFFVSSLQYCVASRGLDTLVNIIMRCITKDVKDFLAIYIFFLLGFGVAIFVTLDHSDVFLNRHGPTATEWLNLGWGLDILIRRTMGDIGSDKNTWIGKSGHAPYLPYWLMFAWTVLGLVILLNLLISMFSSTYETVQDEAHTQWRLAKGRRVLLLERRIRMLCDCLTSRLRVNHAAEKQTQHCFIFEETEPEEAERSKLEKFADKAPPPPAVEVEDADAFCN
eukprot:TRINITY_DN55574_c0_g1_i1.p1 TRINITY_DN55574_c0_g1~~TRINITY_DN55574_c0_g1_i1.p1  ORF type:complete len:1413 (+),score=345.53 TRINITY_DN55574_c0_g1_i1:202-4440(+)